jgi:hypothetical protein
MNLRCPLCDSEMCGFAQLWFSAPLGKYRCPNCEAQFKARKTGWIRFTSYLLGASAWIFILPVLLGMSRWLLAGLLAILFTDYLIDYMNKDLIKFDRLPEEIEDMKRMQK